jgi:hypothetical protein
MLAETFDKLYLFAMRLQESLNARLITSTMMETYALAVINVFKIVLTATKYAQLGNSMLIFIYANCRILLESHV